MTKKFLAAVLAATVGMTGMLAGCGSKTDDSASNASTAEKVTPTFMYFVSNSDENFDKTNEMVAELETEYSQDIKFEIINVDENPEAAENFQLVQGQTPALIMLNTNNDISAIEFKCSDKEKLTSDIKAALE
ncbi:MAG: hypothetical protein HFE49_04540 [Clostridia bacterium]|nr:hypothetical protein [Clostridia bacterium]